MGINRKKDNCREATLAVRTRW